uniref:Uncharacterized protein n=1 Tax=Lactuca sativa TaxID=4236 RepID=A0A9R1VTF5_LACSA|nr:hypothetical protein LSAT_V11C400184300 [Lactuca sativa]
MLAVEGDDRQAQALADFLVEIPDTIKGVPMTISIDPLEPKTSKELWKLYTDGATSKEDSGACLILQSPKGEEITYALQYDFQEYLAAVCSLASMFKRFFIKQTSQEKNARADARSKLASTSYGHLTKKLLVEMLPKRSINNQRVNTVSNALEWNKPYVDYLCHGVLPNDPEEARKVKIRVSHLAIRDNQLYR